MRLSDSTQPTTAAQIVACLGGRLVGNPEFVVQQLASLDGASADSLSFVAQARYAQALRQTRAGCIILSEALSALAPAGCSLIVTPDPYLYFARLSQWWVERMQAPATAAIHPTAVVDASAHLGSGVTLGPFVVVEAGAQIGDGAVVGAHGYVGAGAHLGQGTRLAARVTLGAQCTVGQRCIIHSGVVIGADGFGFAPKAGAWEKIAQLGAVRIGDEVEIGANTCIDRGALEDTVIGDGVKLDNLIQIGHNVKIGAHTAMAGCVGVAGSAIIGQRCMIGGAAMILGHLSLADDVHISVGSVVMRSIHKSGLYSGVFPIDENASWEKNAATLRQLHQLRERLRKIEGVLPIHPNSGSAQEG